MKIFISYGHDEYVKIVKKIKHDLERLGFLIKIDFEDLKATDDWEIKLEEAIKDSEEILFFITPHSTRRPDGYCLNELSFAIYHNKTIIPIMLKYCVPPLSICRLQWIDAQDIDKNNNNYKKFLLELKDLLKDSNKLEKFNKTELYRILQPIDFDYDIERYTKSFVGRKWLVDIINKWIYKNYSNILWISAEAGFGKSAFAAYLAKYHPRVSGIHFFQYDNYKKLDTKRFIFNLVFQLTTQIPEYREILLNFDWEVVDFSIIPFFEDILVKPLNNINNNDVHIFIIDGLDELLKKGDMDIINLISRKFTQLPSWFKIIITSRPEPILNKKLSNIEKIEIASFKKNIKKDSLQYIENNLYSNHSIIDNLLKTSEGNMLYLQEYIKIFNNYSSIENITFPKSLIGIYFEFFERKFNDTEYYKNNIRPLLELICVANYPLKLSLIQDILNLDDYEMADIIESLGSFIKVNKDGVRLYHNSIVDWLIDLEKSGKNYYVSVKKGHERIISYYKSEIKNKVYNTNTLKLLPLSFIALDSEEELINYMKNIVNYLIDNIKNNTTNNYGLPFTYNFYDENIELIMNCIKFISNKKADKYFKNEFIEQLYEYAYEPIRYGRFNEIPMMYSFVYIKLLLPKYNDWLFSYLNKFNGNPFSLKKYFLSLASNHFDHTGRMKARVFIKIIEVISSTGLKIKEMPSWIPSFIEELKAVSISETYLEKSIPYKYYYEIDYKNINPELTIREALLIISDNVINADIKRI